MKRVGKHCLINALMVFYRKNITHKIPGTAISLLCCLLVLGSLLGLNSVITQTAKAQGTAYVQIDGIPPVLDSPLLADLERNYRQGVFRVQFVLISPSRQPRSFQFKLTLEHNGDQLIEMVSESVSFEPGVYSYATFDDDPAIVFPFSYEEWISQLNPELSNSGILPEGDYLLKIEALPTDPNTLIPTIPGVALFTVRYAEPPLLMTPPDGAAIAAQLPIFSWTPVTGAPLGSTIEYELLITEVLSEQTPAQALESNIEQAHKALIEQTSFVYSPIELPLQPGKVYAWQVQAHDVNDQLPILDRGATEIYTFSVMGEGLGDGLAAWRFPNSSPFLRYDFESPQEIDPNDTELFFNDYLPIDLLGIQTNASFDNVLVDVETQHIIEGAIRLEDSFALEIAINPLNDSFSGYRAVTSGNEMSLEDGLLLNLGSDVLIDSEGVHPKGTHNAQISYSGYGSESWTATYSQDLAINFSPFRITRGRIDFASEGIAKGYADPSGFRLLSQNDPVIAQLPDRLLIDGGRVGYIPLKQGATALVNMEEEDDLFEIDSNRSNRLDLILPPLQKGYLSQPAQFSVELEDVLIDPVTGEFIQGRIVASIVDSSHHYTLDPLGIPLAPQIYTIERKNNSLQIAIEGTPTLFGEPINNIPPATLYWDADQIIRGEIDVDSDDAFAWINPEHQNARLSLNSLNGAVEASLSSPYSAIQIDFSGRLELLAQSELAAQANIQGTYNGDGYISIQKLEPIPLEAPEAYQFDNHAFYINEISSLEMFYSTPKGLEFRIDLEAHLEAELQEFASVKVPILDAELSDSGISFPNQEFHNGTPQFKPYIFNQGGNQFELLAARLPATKLQTSISDTINHNSLSPKYDFAFRITDQGDYPEQLDKIALTIQDASINNGIIEGPILPYSLPAPLKWHFSIGTYQVGILSGVLLEKEGTQSHDLYYSGNMLLSNFQGIDSCSLPKLDLVQSQLTIEGTSSLFTPCSSVQVDGFDLELGNSVLKANTIDNIPSFIFEGELLSISGLTNGGQPLEAPGEISIDLSNNKIVSADAHISTLEFPFPYHDPSFELELTDVSVTEAGFLLTNGSSLTAQSIVDKQQFVFQVNDRFTLGWRPELSNQGSGELVFRDAEEEKVVGYFDEAGYHPVSSSLLEEIPDRILLPDLVTSYLILPKESGIEPGKRSREGIEIKASSDASAFLSVPLLNAGADDSLFPVLIDIFVNDAFAFAGGTIEADYSDSPIELEEYGYPIQITSIRYTPNELQGQRIELTGEIRNPIDTEDYDATNSYLPFKGTLSSEGLVGSILLTESIVIYPNALSLDIRHIFLNTASSGELRFTGELTSPLFDSKERANYIGVEGTFSSSAGNWTYDLQDYQPESLVMGSNIFHTDSGSGYTLDSESGIDLTIAGRIQFPYFNPGFSLGALIDIDRNGITLWPNDDLLELQSLFGGALSSVIEAFDIEYNPVENSVLTTIDGAFIPPFSTSGTNESLIPFSGIQLSSTGKISLLGNISGQTEPSDSEQESLDLLRNLSSMKLLDDAFVINSIKLINEDSRVAMNLEGGVYLPDLDSYSPGFNVPKLRQPLPAYVKVGHDGEILESRTFWNRTAIDSLIQTGSDPRASFKYEAVELDLTPRFPDQVKLFASAHLSVNQRNATSESGQNTPQVDSLLINDIIPQNEGIRLGGRSNPALHPGLIIQEQLPINYLVADIPTLGHSLFELKGQLTNFHATNVSLKDPNQPVFTINGRSTLALEGFSGYFQIQDMVIDPRGVSDLGTLDAPSVIAFQNLASFELNCIENHQNSVSSLRSSRTNEPSPSTRSGLTPVDGPFDAQIRFGKFCGNSLPLTLTDRWFTGIYDEFNLSSNNFSSNALQINGVELQLSNLASFQGSLTYDDTSEQPYFQVDGETTYKTLELTGTGSLKQRGSLPSLSILFSPSRKPLEIIPDYGFARIPGGGLFYRPTESELSLVSLALDERSNNTFTSNHPSIQHSTDLNVGDELSFVAPIEFALETGNTSIDFSGIGLLHDNEQFSYLDLDGALYDTPEQLQTDLFLINRSPRTVEESNASLLFEGLSNISLNYTSVVGGVIPGNFTLSYSPDSMPTWSSNGYSEFILTDTIQLPGSFLINPNGFALNLQDTVRLNQGHLSVDDKLTISLWHQRDQPEIQGYTSFITSVDLLPGYMLNQDKIHGALIKDRDEYQIYAARNQYVDVPFVFNGPIDPWLAFQDGNTFGGDARNSVFKRMLQDARVSSQRISGLAEEATNALQQALDLQSTISQSPLEPKELSTFSKSGEEISRLGEQVSNISSQFIASEDNSSTLESIQEDLYEDSERPAFSYAIDEVHASEAALESLNQMRSSITQARRSAELDIYAFQTISPRPLLWLADYVDLAPELEESPQQLSDSSSTTGLTSVPFAMDPVIARMQTRSLVAFKQNNESVDSQFLRAISGLENNLINLKTVRTPEQAFDFEIANNSIRQFYAQQIADDWEMLDWSNQKKDWLITQESLIEDGIRDHLSKLSDLEDPLSKLKQVAQQQHALSREIGQNTSWTRDDIPEGTSYNQYVNNLPEAEIENEFVRSAKALWFDAPMASLDHLSDSLSQQLKERIELYHAFSDTLNKVSDSFSKTLDPLYDVQTQYTTTLFGMADEYRIWRSSIRGLDPEAVDYSFQFTPYRGNYRILAEDLTPPVIKDIVVSPTTTGFYNQTQINWETEHPVELAEISLSIAEDTSKTTYFTSLATSTSTSYSTTKTDFTDNVKDVSLTLRVRGAAGVPVIKKGQFSVQLAPTEQESSSDEITLIPFDRSPPPSPKLSGLTYSSYFSETPNTLQFRIGALRDPESGIAKVEYSIESENGKSLIQDWTSLPLSTTYFGGRVIETSLPVQEDELTVNVNVRITNGRGLTSIASEELELDLDVSPPTSSIKDILYRNAFENTYPNSLAIEIIDIEDEESGIDKVEYTISKEAQANLANASWSEFLSLPNRPTRTGSQTVYIPLDDRFVAESSNDLSIFFRVTNGAGLQNVVQETIQVPGRDSSAPTEPSVSLQHTGFYNSATPNQLHIIAGNSSDFESGIDKVLYRVLDGQTGQVILDWEDFLLFNQTYPTFIIPTAKKSIQLPDFESSRSVIVEVQSINRAGLASTKAIRFLPIELDLTPPTTPDVLATYFSSKSPLYTSSILLDIGSIEDNESSIQTIEFRIISPETQQVIQDWTSLDIGNGLVYTFPGSVRIIESPELLPNANHVIQVRSTNLVGLSKITEVNLAIEKDDTPPLSPNLQFSYSESSDSNQGNLKIEIGESYDPQTFISQARYRIADLQYEDSLLVPWQAINLDRSSSRFEGVTVQHDISPLESGSRYVIDVEIINGAGLSTRSSAIIDHELINDTISATDSDATLEVFYFNDSNTIRQNELEIGILPITNSLIEIDSLQYKVDIEDRSILDNAQRDRAPSDSWNSIIKPKRNPSGQYIIHADVPALKEAFNSHIQVRLFSKGTLVLESERTIATSNTQDLTPPASPEIDAIYYGPHHPDNANELYVIIHNLEDTQSRISSVSYRITDRQNNSALTSEWIPISGVTSSGIFTSKTVSVELPDFQESALLNVEVRSVNGNNLESITEVPLSVIVDSTPPEFEEVDIFIQKASIQQEADELYIHLFNLSDPESLIESVEYRVLVDNNTDDPFIDWTFLGLPETNIFRHAELRLDLPEYEDKYSVFVELRAKNTAGLSALHSKDIDVNIDTSPPQIQQINTSYKLTTSGSGYLLIEPGSFRDPESQIDNIEYRIVDAASDSTVYMPWRSIPFQKDIRIQLDPITIPRQLLPFDATRTIAVEYRALNGAGLSETQRSTIEIAGDTSSPEASSLSLFHRNGYDPRHPNTIEIQIGPTKDDQSSIESVQYRIINLANREEFTSWTNLPISNDGTFAGKVIYSELPFLSQETDIQVEIEIYNSADLVRKVSKNLTIQVAGDVTPPALEIQPHYLTNAITIVLDKLSDSHSRIQKVEYRLVDNVDQSVLSDWKDLFEIVNPQEQYSRRSYSVSPPEIREGRAVKVEVRATNGAGLQKTASKTLLYQQTESN